MSERMVLALERQKRGEELLRAKEQRLVPCAVVDYDELSDGYIMRQTIGGRVHTTTVRFNTQVERWQIQEVVWI